MGLTKKKAAIVILFAMLIAASILFGNKVASSSRHHSERITYLKEKEENARDLIAGANATAFLISMIPEDTATPNANQIAAIGKDYLIVLSAITAERYMLTIRGGYVALLMLGLGLFVFAKTKDKFILYI